MPFQPSFVNGFVQISAAIFYSTNNFFRNKEEATPRLSMAQNSNSFTYRNTVINAFSLRVC
ncbi:Uncharacterised protein [Leminorella richardii]|uniref:Uncharacterized protein n=1 Tax=Leminorella richardii TaxID=158841 RepID=A0A2X4UV38_9GAMM|nr:Uncharacterised protein [Leminorella richardii]